MSATLGVGFGDGQVSYGEAIQHLLGDQGASLVLGGSAAAPTATLYGSATAKVGTNVEPAVTVTLSAQAQHFLSQGQIALDLLTGKPGAQGPTITIPNQTAQAQATATANAASASAVPGGVAGQIASIIAQAKAEVSDPNFIYNVANPGNHYLGIIDGLQGSAQAGFIQAFNSRTLTIQNVADVEGLDYTPSVTFTGTSQNTSLSINYDVWNPLYAAHDGNIATLGDPLGGSLLLTWPPVDAPASS
jgi:hypothetical protein